MKKYNFCILVFFLSLITVFTVPFFAEADSKTRVAVIDTTDDKKLLQKSNVIANNFIGIMIKSEAITTVERSEVELVMQAQKIADSQLRYASTAAKLGKMVGCQFAVLSSLVYEAAPIVAVRVVDTATSEVIFADIEFPDKSSESDFSSIISASSRLAYKFLEKLTGEQSVITAIEGNEITINRGSLSGVRAGDLYLVYSGTEKNYIDLAVIKVKDVRVNFSYAELVKNGGDIKMLRESDTVTRISKEDSNSIIKRKKFVKKRPDTLTAEKKSRETWNDYEDCLKAAKQGNINAQFNLALMFFNGWEIKQDYKKAVEWFNKAAGKGHAEAQCYLGVMYSTGLGAKFGMKQDYVKAVELYRKAAEQGVVKAQKNLGNMYESGIGVKQDYAKAVELFRKAAEQGDVEAQFWLGHMYIGGLGVKQDYAKAVELYHKAAEQGGAEALSTLGSMYANGWGVKQDYAKAVELFRKSAEQGYAFAQNNLAIMYENGFGVKKDRNKAIEWYRKAAAQGDEEAKQYLKSLGVK